MTQTPKRSYQKFVLDKTLLAILLIFAIVSVTAIYCAEPIMQAYLRNQDLWFKQIVWFSLGAIACIVLIFCGTDRLFSSIKVFYWLFMFLLALLLVDKYILDLPFIKPVSGTTAWYQFPGLGSFQPSEFMKVILIIRCAQIIQDHNEEKQEMSFSSDISLFIKILKVILPPILLILPQPETGIPIIMVVSILVMLCVSGIRKEWFFLGLACLALLFGGLIFLYYFNPSLLTGLFGSTYKLRRIYGWLDPEYYKSSWGMQLYTSLLTLGSSGLAGSGFRQKIIYFPEPQTDFIFTVIGQNFGLIGTGFVILLCTALDLKLCHIAYKYQGEREKLLVIGLVGMLAFQQFQNIGMISGLMPITGITLPFISYGGSSMLSYMIPLSVVFMMSSENKIKQYH